MTEVEKRIVSDKTFCPQRGMIDSDQALVNYMTAGGSSKEVPLRCTACRACQRALQHQETEAAALAVLKEAEADVPAASNATTEQ